MRRPSPGPFPSLALGLALSVVSCGGTGQGGSGGAPATGGSAGSPGSGGTAPVGGATGGGGSAGKAGAAGQAGTGGRTGTGGSAGKGGGTGAGGSAGAGGRGGSGGSAGMKGSGGAAGSGSSGSAGKGATGGSSGATGTGGGASAGACGAGDTNLPAEPKLPTSVCATLSATQNVATDAVPDESTPDTPAIQSALTACSSGSAVKLVASGSNNAFLTGPIKVPSGVTLWVDAGVTLYGTRDPNVYGSASSLIAVTGSGSGIVGDGVIDGQGGEPQIGGTQSWWDLNAGSSGNSPALIQVSGATNFTLYRITLHNSPKFHVKLSAAGFVVWGVTIKTPSKATNSAGTALSYSNAHNTDGIDPGESASDGTIACSFISDGDDHIAIKGSSSTGVTNLTIAHNHFEAGHGMSIGSEFTGGVSGIKVYDLSIDQTDSGTSGGSSNGIRIKSDSSRGGLVNDVTYSDVCMKGVYNPILLTPFYSSNTGSDIPQYTNIKFQNVHVVSGGSNSPHITLDGYDDSHLNSVTLDNVIVDGVSSSNVHAQYTDVTMGPGDVSFTPSGTSVTVTNNVVSGSSTPNPCTNKWVTF
ncbi:MAG TPA: glycosyl hydrolase family 28 protein [Polyangia bacterium]|nr:glycosyl hydrolase family 28 protein [Polyangia bacterium]